jgi:AAA domain
MTFKLPTQLRVKALATNPHFMLLYSNPKVGKTEAASQLAGNLLLDIENGSDYCSTGLILKCENWKQVEQMGKEILTQKELTGKWPYQYLTVDTATELEVWCDGLGKQLYLNAPMAKKEYKENPERLASITILPGQDGAYGPGYLWLRIAYTKCIEYLQTLAPHLILLAHVKDKELVDKTGKEIQSDSVHSKNLDLTGKLKAITCSKADSIGYMYRKVVGGTNGKQDEELWVNFHGSEIMAGSRPKHLAGANFKFDWEKIFIPE